MNCLNFVVTFGCLVAAVNAACNCGSSEWCVPDATHAEKTYDDDWVVNGFQVCKDSDCKDVIETETTAWDDVDDKYKTCVVCSPLESGTGTNWDNVEKIIGSETNLNTWTKTNECKGYYDAGVYKHAKYTWEGLKGAVKRYPEFCASEDSCKKELAVFFGNAFQETGCLTLTGEASAADGTVTEHPEYGRYKGRGILQLTWPTNYMLFSKRYYGDERCLLGEKRSTIQDDSEVLWAVGIDFFLNTPSKWTTFVDLIAKGFDFGSGTISGFGLTNMAINGNLECGSCTDMKTHQKHRVGYFADMCKNLGISDSDWDWCKDAKEDIDSKSEGAKKAYCYYYDKDFGYDDVC